MPDGCLHVLTEAGFPMLRTVTLFHSVEVGASDVAMLAGAKVRAGGPQLVQAEHNWYRHS